MPEDMPDRMPEDMPGRMPEDMPDRMPEDMSDRMPEDLPVTKRINVMVGITRNKVIIYHGLENLLEGTFLGDNRCGTSLVLHHENTTRHTGGKQV